MARFAVAGIVQVETIVKVDEIPVQYSPVVNKPNTIFTNVGGDAYNERVALWQNINMASLALGK